MKSWHRDTRSRAWSMRDEVMEFCFWHFWIESYEKCGFSTSHTKQGSYLLNNDHGHMAIDSYETRVQLTQSIDRQDPNQGQLARFHSQRRKHKKVKEQNFHKTSKSKQRSISNLMVAISVSWLHKLPHVFLKWRRCLRKWGLSISTR